MRRALIGMAVLLVLLAGAAALAAGALLNTGEARGRIVAAIERATGHPAQINGRIGVAWSLAPAFSVENLVLLNRPGFSRPEFASVRRLEARVALLPLLSGRVEVPAVTAVGADVLLERDAAGRGNWLPPPAPAEAAPAGPSRPREPVKVGQVRIEDGRVAWLGAPALEVRSFTAAPGGGPLAGTLVVNGVPLDVKGETTGAAFNATAAGSGVLLAASGGAGRVAFQASAADLSTLSPLLGRPLPSLRDVMLTGQAGTEGLGPLNLAAGASDLGSVLPGLHLVQLKATAAGLDQPVQVLAQLSLRDLPVALAANVARPGIVQAVLSADGAAVNIQGAAGTAGLEGTVSGRVPDLQRTGTLAGLRLPALRDVALDARVLPVPGAAGMQLRGLRFTSGQGDVAGDITVRFKPRLSVRGYSQSQRLDLDAWTSLPPPPPAAPTTATPAQAVAPAPPPAGPQPHWLIPGQPLPFAALRRADADLRASVGDLAYRGVDYHGAEIRLLLEDGRLRLDPASVVAPGGPLRATVQADASAEPPTAALTLRGTGIDASALSDLLGTPGAMRGAVDVDVDLRGAGATAHALAAGASGQAALALTDGEIENAALASVFGAALRGANVPFDVAGRSRVRCLALQMDIAGGRATVPILALDASRLRIEGDGVLNLANETMDLHLRPEIRLGPLPVKVPVHLTGPWRAPQPQVDKGVIAPGRYGFAIGGSSADPCGPALAAIHQGLVR